MTNLDPLEARIKFLEELEKEDTPDKTLRYFVELRHPSTLRMLRGLYEIVKRELGDHGADCDAKSCMALKALAAEIREKP